VGGRWIRLISVTELNKRKRMCLFILLAGLALITASQKYSNHLILSIYTIAKKKLMREVIRILCELLYFCHKNLSVSTVTLYIFADSDLRKLYSIGFFSENFVISL
jgi:hypothetical protein